MLIISEEDRAFLRVHVENADALIDAGNARDLLIELNYVMLRKGFKKNGFYNDFGNKAQAVHDRVYEDNK